jgi:Protein of unknown function (DUF3572)
MAFFKRPKAQALDLEGAETAGLAALAFLAGEPDRLGRFLALTGLGPDDLRAAAGSPAVLGAVLEHLLADESMLLMFAHNAGLAPESIAAAHHLITNPPSNR